MDGSNYWHELGRRRMGRRAVLKTGAVVTAGLAAGSLVACGGGSKNGGTTSAGTTAPRAGTQAAGAGAPKPGGTLAYNLNDNPPSLNLWQEFTFLVSRAVAPVFNQLVQLDPMDESKVIPDLAKSYEYTNPDKTEIVFKLQDAPITFHDGQAFTADDVKVTYDWLRNPPKGVPSPRTTSARNVDAVEVVDPKTVKFKLKLPAASFLNSISNHHHAMGAKHIVTQTNTLLDGQQRPIGTGPYVFKDFKRDNVIDMERNKAYWRQGRPYLDTLSAFIIQTNATAVTNFLSNQLQLFSPVLVSDLSRIEKELGNRGTIDVTASLGRVALIPNGARPPFNDVRMREALSAAIDRDEFNKVIFEGRALKGAYNNPKGPWALPESELVKFTGYNGKQDIQKAKQLLTAAGFPDGFKGRMPVRQDFEQNAVALQAQLKKAGFDFSLEVEKSAVFTQRALAGDWDVLTHTWATPLDDPDDSFAEMLIRPDRAGRNWAKIVTPEVDRLFDLQRVEFDPEKRKKLVNDADRAALANYPNIVVVYEPGLGARQGTVKDFKPHVSNFTNQRFENVWLAKS